MRDIILFCIVFASLPFTLMRPQVGIVMWTWLSYMNPHRLAFGFAYRFPFCQIVGIVTLISLFFDREKKRFPWTFQTTVWLAFILWMTITSCFALNPNNVWVEWEKYMKIQLFALLTVVLMAKRERINLLVWTIVISIGFFGVKGGLFSLLTARAYRVWGPAYSFIEDNNALALALIMIFPLMWYLHATAKRQSIRWSLRGAMLLIALSVLTSYSRGAFVAMSAMAFCLWLKSHKKLQIGIAFLVIAGVLLSSMPSAWFSRMHTIETYQQDPSAMTRIHTWTFALNLALDNPITGGGFQAFSRPLFFRYASDPSQIKDSHSIYFGVLAEHGFPGLLMFLALLFLTFRNAAWVIRSTANHKDLNWARVLASMVQISLIGYAVGGAFLGLAYFDLFYNLIGIVAMVRMIVSDSIAKIQHAVVENAADPQGTNLSTLPDVVAS